MITGALSKFPSGSLIGQALRLPLRLIPDRAVVTVRSGINEGMKWVAGSGVHGYWLGHFEEEKQDLVQRLVSPGMTVFDIGANVGFYTLAFSRLVGAAGHVWAFEPFAANATALLKHLELNGVANVKLVQAAVAERQGISGFRGDANHSEGAMSKESEPYLVPTVALDVLVDQSTLPVPDVIKMDVEGAESQVLQGAERLLAGKRTTILIALHGSVQTQACMAFLDHAGYQAFSLDGQRFAPGKSWLDEIYATPIMAARTSAAAPPIAAVT